MGVIYKINDVGLRIDCDDKLLLKLIEKRLSMFEFTNEYSNYIIIKSSLIKICINQKLININGRVFSTDLYPILNNIISSIINNKNDIYLHSSVLSYNNHGVLLLGDFGSGKTTLCLEAEKQGFNINSADQTWISKLNNKIYLKKGSKYLKYKNHERFLPNSNINKNVCIEKIIILRGVCENGKVSFIKIDNKLHLYKDLAKYATWHSDQLLFTSNYTLPVDKKIIKEFLIGLDIDSYYVRGDSHDIIKVLKEKIL